MIFLLIVFFAFYFFVENKEQHLALYYAIMIIVPINTTLSCEPAAIEEYSMEWFYFQTQLAFYFFTLVTERHVDMVIHRLIVVAVLAFAFVFHFETVAIAVLRLHDVGDLLIYLSQDFTITASIFAITRLIVFPWFIFGRCIFKAQTDAQWIGVGGLIAIQGMHLYWAFKNLKKE